MCAPQYISLQSLTSEYTHTSATIIYIYMYAYVCVCSVCSYMRVAVFRILSAKMDELLHIE